MNLTFYKKVIKKKLSRIINKGDVIYVESDLTSFREIFKLSKSKKQFLNFFFQILKNLIGKRGTLIVPSFSHSWGDNEKKKIFNLNTSISKTGIFPEYLKNMKNTYRTLDPMFSCLINGNKYKIFLKVGKNTFGASSIFEKLNKHNAKLVSFGLKRFDPTFVHYVEQYYDENIKKIKYRYLKKLKGVIIYKNKKYKDEFFTFLRNKKHNKFFNEKRIKKDLMQNKKLKKINILGADIYVVKARDFFTTGINGMKKKVNYFVN